MAQLVQSNQDGIVYVRKTPIHFTVHICEMCMYRPHPLVPELTDSAGHFLGTGQHLVNPARTYWKYCNGGDLLHLNQAFKATGSFFPEALVWRCFRQILDVLEHIHHLEPPVAHRDIMCANIFVHWPAGDCTMPDFYLGDFGAASLVAPDTNCTKKAIAYDFSNLANSVDEMARGDGTGYQFSTQSKTGYSNLFFETLKRLQDLAIEASFESAPRINVDTIKDMIKVGSRVAPKVTDDRVRRFKPTHDLQPLLYDSEEGAKTGQADVVGPWRIARVDPGTFAVLEVCNGVYTKDEQPSTDPYGLPTDSDPAAGGMGSAEFQEMKEQAAAAGMTISEFEVSRQAGASEPEDEDGVYQMTSSDERQMAGE